MDDSIFLNRNWSTVIINKFCSLSTHFCNCESRWTNAKSFWNSEQKKISNKFTDLYSVGRQDSYHWILGPNISNYWVRQNLWFRCNLQFLDVISFGSFYFEPIDKERCFVKKNLNFSIFVPISRLHNIIMCALMNGRTECLKLRTQTFLTWKTSFIILSTTRLFVHTGLQPWNYL